MAQKRIKMVRQDILGDRLRLLYDDGTQGVLDYERPFLILRHPSVFRRRALSGSRSSKPR